MPLTKRQKRRLKEVSRMIESTIVIKDDMVDIQLEYSKEIDEVIKKFKRQKEGLPHESDDESKLPSTNSDNSLLDSQETAGSTGEPQLESNFDPPINHVDNVPSWAKGLWKKIAMKCHPDRLNFQKLSAIEIAKRQEYMVQARNVLEAEDWNKLLHIGVQVDEWTEELTSTMQLQMLNLEYTSATTRIGKIQESLAWQWGTNWDNIPLRVNIVNAVCQHYGMSIPDRIKLIEIIQNLESE
jgi:hypothetical protein